MAANLFWFWDWRRVESWPPGRIGRCLMFLVLFVPTATSIVVASGYSPIPIMMLVFGTLFVWRMAFAGVYVRNDMVKFRRVCSTRIVRWASVDSMLTRPHPCDPSDVRQLVLVLTDGTEYPAPLFGWTGAGRLPTDMQMDGDFVRSRADFDRSLTLLVEHQQAHR